MIIDLHNHTTEGSPDSKLTSFGLFEFASQLRIDGIGITEHGSFESSNAVRKASKASGVLAFQGIEYSIQFAHLLVYGASVTSLFPLFDDQLIDTVFLVELAKEHRRVTIATLKNAIIQRFEPEKPQTAANINFEANSKECCIIFAHPFSYIGEGKGFYSIFRTWINEGNGYVHMYSFLKYVSDHVPDLINLAESADAIETANGAESLVENFLARNLAIELNKPQTGGSDAHFFEMVGRCVTVFQKKITGPAELVDEIKANKVTSRDYLDTDTILNHIGRYLKHLGESNRSILG